MVPNSRSGLTGVQGKSLRLQSAHHDVKLNPTTQLKDKVGVYHVSIYRKFFTENQLFTAVAY